MSVGFSEVAGESFTNNSSIYRKIEAIFDIETRYTTISIYKKTTETI